MKLLEKLDSSFVGLICLSESSLKFSDPRVQQVNYLSNQLLSQGKSFHLKQRHKELLCFTQLFGKEFFVVSKQLENNLEVLNNLNTIEQLIKKVSLENPKIAVLVIDVTTEIADKFINYLDKSFSNIKVELV